jgi:hypothetical protein
MGFGITFHYIIQHVFHLYSHLKTTIVEKLSGSGNLLQKEH